MFVRKNLTFRSILVFSGGHLVWLVLWSVLVVALYEYAGAEWLSIPWVPLAVIGTAVAFYVGFKNNSAYDRLWEARKIWGAIVNDSRSWGAGVRAFVTDQFRKEPVGEEELRAAHGRLVRRHIAWSYALRGQLLVPTSWEHVRQNRHIARANRKRMRWIGVGLYDDGDSARYLERLLPAEEVRQLAGFANPATQLIDRQAQELKELRAADLIDDFRHMELQQLLRDFYTHQGRCERIKKFPLPRQYGGASLIFVGIFIFLLPLGMVSEFAKLGPAATWLSVPFTVIVGWVYLMMELIGDYSENPFEGLGNDVPMLSLCRTIEIDLLQMLGEKDVPPPIEPKNGVLM